MPASERRRLQFQPVQQAGIRAAAVRRLKPQQLLRAGVAKTSSLRSRWNSRLIVVVGEDSPQATLPCARAGP
jgi:hypothetical protein